jgi:UDP-N-acetylglucosamine 2-epimerase (non-hydrolysing)
VGTNDLVGTDPKAIEPALKRLFEGKWKKGSIPAKWDGKAGERVVSHLMALLN